MPSLNISDHFTYSRLIRFSLPNVIIMVFTSLYTIVDGLFVSNLVGATAFAALNLIWPPIGILQTIGFMVGTGGAALVSRLLGEGKKDLASQVFSMLMVFLLVVGISCSLLALFNMQRLALFLGADSALLPDCLAYGRPLVLLVAFSMFASSLQSFLVTISKSKIGLVITLAGGFLNILLDYYFIAGLGMGIAGAAWATGLNWMLTAILPLFFFTSKRSLHFCRFSWRWRAIVKTLTNGSSEMITNVSISVVAALYNFELISMIGPDGVVSYGILQYISFVFVALFLGYTVAIMPVVGFNFGAKRNSELRNILIKSLVLVGLSSLVIFALAEYSARMLASVFVSYDPALMNLTTRAIQIYSFSFLLAGFNIFTSSFFTGLNNGLVSATISFCRTFLFQVLCILIMPALFGLDGIWNAINVSEVLSFILSVSLLFAYAKRYGYGKAKRLPK